VVLVDLRSQNVSTLEPGVVIAFKVSARIPEWSAGSGIRTLLVWSWSRTFNL